MILLRLCTTLLGSQSGSHSPAFLYLFLDFDASLCSALALSSLGNSDKFVLVSIDFSISSVGNVPFHQAVFDYSCGYWDGVLDHIRDNP